MKRFLSLFAVLSLASAVRAQDGSFPDNFPPLNPPSINKKSITLKADPKEKEKKKQEKGKNEMPSMPGGGGGGDQGGDKGAGAGGKNCSSCGGALKDSTAQLEGQLNAANPADAKTKMLIDKARKTVADAKKTSGDLDGATAKMKDANKSLDEALKEIKSKNDQGAKDVEKLDKEHQKRGQTVSKADPSVPQCTDSGASAAAAPAAAPSSASKSIGTGKQLLSAAKSAISGVQNIPGDISQAGTDFQTAASQAGQALGVSNLGGAAKLIFKVASDANDYYNTASSAQDAGGKAVDETDAARTAQEKAAKTIGEAGTKSGTASQTVSQLCTQMNALPKDEAGKAAAAKLLTSMTSEQTKMEAVLKGAKKDLESAVEAHQKGQSANSAFARWLAPKAS